MQNNSAGQFLEMDTSVFNIFTSEDKSLPRSLTIDNDGKSKFEKYVPFDSYVVTIKNYPLSSTNAFTSSNEGGYDI